MSKLQSISERVRNQIAEERNKEIAEISSNILNSPEIPTYPLNLFNIKFYGPFRALVNYGVDSIQIASKAKYGEVRSSLFRDWMSICVLPTNKVAIIDTKKNNAIVAVLPPIIRSVELKDGEDYSDGNMNSNLVRASQLAERGDVKGSLLKIDEVGREMMDKFKITKEANEENRRNWIEALDTIDKYLGRDPKEVVKQLGDVLKSNPLVNVSLLKTDDKKIQSTEELTDAFD